MNSVILKILSLTVLASALFFDGAAEFAGNVLGGNRRTPRRDRRGKPREADFFSSEPLAGKGKNDGAKSGPLPGQIIIDPQHPQWLKHQGGKHIFICGPGDPEDFLYRGRRRANGTRAGDQVKLIKKLIKHGGNCIYLQAVRSHGGDGKPDHNPFVDSDPRRGIDMRILNQWEEWFTLMDRHNILIYFFFYDDNANPWRQEKTDRNQVSPRERRFLETIVKKFQHHKNLIWIVAEESEEAFSIPRMHAIARVIQQTDQHDHVIGNHHHSGTRFTSWQKGGPLHHFAMQYNVAGTAAMHNGAVRAFRQARGKYQVIYAENTEGKPDAQHAWASAMGGLMPTLLEMDIASTPTATLEQCRHLQHFFEATDFYTMEPHDELAHAGTQWLLANPGTSYIAYAENLRGDMGIKKLPAGSYRLDWLDCRTGRKSAQQHLIRKQGDSSFARPQQIGRWCAVRIRKQAAK